MSQATTKTIPKRFWEDEEWALKNLGKLQEKYTNKWIAVVNKKVAGVGEDGDAARKQAHKKTGVKEVPVIFVESGQNLY